MKIKRKILTALALCAAFAAFTAGCSKINETFGLPDSPDSVKSELIPSEKEEPSEPTEEQRPVPAVSVTFNGESFGYISPENNISETEQLLISEKLAELEALGLNIKDIQLDSELSFTDLEAYSEEIKSLDAVLDELRALGLKFRYTVIEKEYVSIKFDTVYEKSSAYYEGTEKTKTEGKNGEKELTFESVYAENVQVSRTQVASKTVKNAQSKVILVGTKKSTASTGKYIYPLKSVYVTSKYGPRTLNGKYDYHYGVDFRASNGTSVMASDGGKVIYAGKMGSYGTLIKIEHDNGNVTYYAHLSSLSVKVGQRVYQGQIIAKSGSTGNVTGPHLHFEIRINGKHKDPLLYLK